MADEKSVQTELGKMLDPAKDEGKTALARLVGRGLGADVELGEVLQLSGGASSATWQVEVEKGCGIERLIFQRTASAEHTSLPRWVQAEVATRAGALGVPVAPVVAVARPEDGLGDAVVTRMMPGEALAPRWLRQPDYAAAREKLTRQCAEALARLHSAPITHWNDLPLVGGSGAGLLERSFEVYRRIGVDVPAFDLAFAFLKPRMPQTPATCLVHGDFRSGNLLITPEGLAAVIDWELTHLSVPGEDLGWLCAQAWRFGKWEKPVGGFGTREALLEAYRAAGGTITDEELHLWEVYGNLKWGMSCLQLADDHVSGRVPSVERAVIGRRVSEVAADLSYLIAFGDL